MKVVIIGQNGFVGNHLYNYLKLDKSIQIIDFDRKFFDEPKLLDEVLSQADSIVHLAGLNRHENQQTIYDTNILLTQNIIASLARTKSTPHIIFSSSTQEEQDNLYGKSKKQCSELLRNWATNNKGQSTSIIIPNVFGAFGKPFYNSVVATFCHQLNCGQAPKMQTDGTLKLIYVHELIHKIKNIVVDKKGLNKHAIPHSKIIKVSEILEKLLHFKEKYLLKGELPKLHDTFDINLFNTFRSYIPIKKHFPVFLQKHTDDRGSFIETLRTDIGGQVSFSTTKEGVTRGEHFHLRKIERFVVIKGKALIQMRRIGTNDILEFELDGDKPAYVDMPIWYTHNIKNIGAEELYTIFYINEFFNPEDSDTFFEKVVT